MNSSPLDLDTEAALRDLLGRALALQVLDPEDVLDPSAAPLDPHTLTRLEESGRLSAAAREALEALCRLRPRSRSELAPGAEAPRALSLGAPAGGGTLDGERAPGASAALELAPAPRALSLGAPAGGGTLDGERAPGASAALHTEAASLRGAGTLDGARGIGASVALGLPAERAEESLPGSGVELELLDPSVLEPAQQRAIQSARVLRVAIRLEKLTWEQARAAWEIEGDVSEWLADQGYLNPFEGMEVFAAAQATREICPRTLRPLTRASRGTLLPGASEPRGVEGFPGVGGHFADHELLGRVAEGAMGVVFRARHLKLNRIVAMKVMRGGALASESRKRRFLNEAEAAGALTHPAIVPVHEINEVNGYPFYTMDLVEGSTLDLHVVEQACPPLEIARLLQVLAEGVQHFHRHGIIHRDLKPENVLVAADGPKIIDFGIAKRLEEGEESTGGTVDGALIGTPEYMAPEQAAGRVREVDIRTDVYALGVIGYQLLSGKLPFTGTHAAIVLAIQERDPAPLRSLTPELDRDLAAVVEMAMAKEPERRYQSAAELAEDLARYIGDLPVVARPATLRYRLRKAIRRNSAAFAAAGVCVLALGSSGGFWLARRLERSQRVAQLLAQAADTERPDARREELLTQALTLDPDNPAATSARLALREHQEAEERLAEQEARLREQRSQLEAQEALRKAEQAQAELAQERALREAASLKEREQARLEAEARSQAAAGERARGLLELSRRHEEDPLRAIAEVSDALVLLGSEASELHDELEGAKLRLALSLASGALEREEIGMVRFWLREAGKLQLATQAQARALLEPLRASLERLVTGEGHLIEAKRLAQEGRWLEARARLALAEAQGLKAETLAAEGSLIRGRCAELSTQNVASGQAALGQGDLPLALTCAARALEFAPESEPAKVLFDQAELRLIDAAQREAARLFLTPATRAGALALLEQTERLVRPGPAEALASERRARSALLAEQAAERLVYLPRLLGGEVGGVYLQRFEVTNEDFAGFVRAGGYGDDSLWDEGSAGSAARLRGAPQSWREGSYGDPTNALRPVRGVSLAEARAYARWRSRETGQVWRLPRAKEWEFAAGWEPASARARPYPWGQDPRAWTPSRQQQPDEVGRDERDRSALGVCGLAGGVMEWVEEAEGPATKGACWAAPAHLVERYARVAVSGFPGSAPPPELIGWIGLRLIREGGQ